MSFARKLLGDARALVLAVVVGGILALQSSSSLDAVKIVYFAVVAAAVVGCAKDVHWWLADERRKVALPWLAVSGAFIVLLVVSLPVSLWHGASLSLWLRDAAAYGMFAAAPVLGLAWARAASTQWTVRLAVLCGLATSISYALTWLTRRSIVGLPFDHVVFPSPGLSAALIAVAVAIAVTRAGWARWAALAGLVLGLLLASGSRANLVLFLVPIGVGLAAGRPWRRGARTLAVVTLVAGLVFAAIAAAVGASSGGPLFDLSGISKGTNNPGGDRSIGERVGGVAILLTDPGSDPSFKDRITQTGNDWRDFVGNPVFGVGPGYTFTWLDSYGNEHSAITQDTPVIYLAKFGLVGLIPVGLFVAAYLGLLRGIRRAGEAARRQFLAVLGYGIVLVATVPLGSPMEDKGVSFAMIIILGLGCGALLRARTAPESPVSSGSTALLRDIPG